MRQTSPSLSVILSTYNQPEWLEKVLWGYGVQEFRDFEIVVADDGSESSTLDCIERMRRQVDFAIHHVWHADNGFQKCSILNHAICCASAEYLVFSDGDCIPRRDFLATHYSNRARGRYLSGGAVRLPLELSRAITAADIVEGNPFSIRWLRKHTGTEALPRWSRLIRVHCPAQLATVLDRATPTRPTWNGNNASAWKSDILAVNGMDERMAYGGEDCELGERLVNAGVTPKQLRFSASLLHLDHSRGYVREDAIRRNQEIRRITRQTAVTWTNHGIIGNHATSSHYSFNGEPRLTRETLYADGGPRLFICDAEIVRAGGHNVELASVIADAALRKGLQPVILTHRDFSNREEFSAACVIRPTFRFAFMRKWSLGVDGKSVHERDIDGRIVSPRGWNAAVSSARELVSSTSPAQAIATWSHDFARWCQEFRPTGKDRILLSTACDFTLVGLAAALQKVDLPTPLRIDLLFHLSLWDGREGEPHHRGEVLSAFRRQVESSLDALQGHEIRLLATTEELARQLNQAVGHSWWSKIDYPIRPHEAPRRSVAAPASPAPASTASANDGSANSSERLRLLIAGNIRREKGRYELSKTISAIWDEQLAAGHWQLAFQSPAKRWKRLLPKPLWERVDEFKAYEDRELFLNTSILDTDAYQDWIRSASVGLFTYDARRYFARCSGVLLEMLIAGIPVIVPAGSWLSHQLRPEADRHLDEVWDGAVERDDVIVHYRAVERGGVMELDLQQPASAIVLSFTETPHFGDSIELNVNFYDSVANTPLAAAKYSVEHRRHGEPKVLIALPPGATSISVHYGRLIHSGSTIAPPRIRFARGHVAPPESSGGLIAADLDQIPRLLNEFATHRDHYERTALAAAPSWAARHSPDRFMAVLLDQPRLHYQTAAA